MNFTRLKSILNSILKVDMSVRAGKLHNYTAQEIATQRWRLQMAFFIQFCFKTMYNRL